MLPLFMYPARNFSVSQVCSSVLFNFIASGLQGSSFLPFMVFSLSITDVRRKTRGYIFPYGVPSLTASVFKDNL